MNIIIDTPIFLWALSDPSRLSERHLAELETPANTIWLSSVSVAEIMMKASIGKLTFDFDAVAFAEKSGFELLDYSARDALPLMPHQYFGHYCVGPHFRNLGGPPARPAQMI